jgi:hypothetical protein
MTVQAIYTSAEDSSSLDLESYVIFLIEYKARQGKKFRHLILLSQNTICKRKQ